MYKRVHGIGVTTLPWALKKCPRSLYFTLLTNADLKICQYLPLHMKIMYVEDFTLKQLLLFEICARDICEKFVNKHSRTIEKVENWAYFLWNLQTLLANNSRILRIKNGKCSGYCFYMNTNIYRDFQICISVPLISNHLKEIGKNLDNNSWTYDNFILLGDLNS